MWWKKATNNLQTLIEHHLILSQTTKDTYPWQKIFLWGLCLLWFSIPLLLAWEKVYHQSKLISPSLWPWNREAKILSTSPLQPEHLRPKRCFRPNFSRQKGEGSYRLGRAGLGWLPHLLPCPCASGLGVVLLLTLQRQRHLQNKVPTPHIIHKEDLHLVSCCLLQAYK